MKGKEIAGWTVLLGLFTGMVTLIGSMAYTPKSHMKNQYGKDFSVFERVFMPAGVARENRAALEESISKKMNEITKAKQDSTAAVTRAHNDSIKAAMAMKKMKPRHVVAKPQVRIPQKH